MTPGWTQLTSTSWSLPAFAQLSDVSLSFHVPASTASVNKTNTSKGKLSPALVVFFLLPLIGLRRSGKRGGRMLSILLLAASFVSISGLTGCGAHNGFFGQAGKTYTVTVTVTTGTLSHSTDVTLTVE